MGKMILLSLCLAASAWTNPPVPALQPPTRLPAAHVRSQAQCALLLDLKLPKGWKLDAHTPLRWRFTEIYAGFTFAKRKDQLLSPRLPVHIPFKATTGATGARLMVDFRYCRKASCVDGNADYLVVIQADEKESRTEIPVTIQVTKN